MTRSRKSGRPCSGGTCGRRPSLPGSPANSFRPGPISGSGAFTGSSIRISRCGGSRVTRAISRVRPGRNRSSGSKMAFRWRHSTRGAGHPLIFRVRWRQSSPRSGAALPGARQFLEALGFAEPDVVAEVIDHVLPRYHDADVAKLDMAQHEADLELVARALAEAPRAGRDQLLEQLRQTTFLVGENAATGESSLMRPGDLY